VLVLAAASTTAGANPGSRAHDLRQQASAIDAEVHGAVLNLYALDSRLSAANARLAGLLGRAGRLRQEQQMIAQQIASTQHTLVASQQQLGANLRALYEVGDPDPIAVIFGAESFNDAVSTLDGLKHVADQSRQFIETSARAEDRLVTLRARLAVRRARIAAAAHSAEQMATQIAAARADRLSFISGLRAQQALKAQQIAALEAAVQQAETKSQELTAAAAASGPTTVLTGGSTTPAPPVATPATAAGGRTLTVSATGYSLPGHTESGLPVSWGVVAVDPTVIPLGTRMTIPGYGEGVAADVGSGIRGAMIDLWFPTLGQALQWGRRTVTITLH
jgi:3D (Asp-Asp-Asp) domain-containing protein